MNIQKFYNSRNYKEFITLCISILFIILLGVGAYMLLSGPPTDDCSEGFTGTVVTDISRITKKDGWFRVETTQGKEIYVLSVDYFINCNYLQGEGQ